MFTNSGTRLFLEPYLSFEDSQEATVALFRGFQHEEVVFFLQNFIFLKFAEWEWTQTGKRKKKVHVKKMIKVLKIAPDYLNKYA